MIQSFTPIIPDKPTVLILGTMPGVASLQQQQYYGHPRNHFWKIIAHLYNAAEIPQVYEDRKSILTQNNIALWDVLEFCEREGSLDIAIKNPVPNQILKLLAEQPNITKILFNGKESHKLFIKYFGLLDKIKYHVVPSTSPANTMKFETKLEHWRQALL
ncbi:DNA-deoxyinosine glycosylase [Flavobacterium sp. SM2513]|uniref:DNA-deoxyinosine glycosylase n=1 Tax=Flavobacterium sp. SM2513 TaxID=3424766 RepID=UPI003D7F1AEC